MTFGMQPLHQPPGVGGLAFLAPVALNPDAGMADAAGMPLLQIANVANVRAGTQAHPWRVHRPIVAAAEGRDDNDLRPQARRDFQTAFASASPVSSEIKGDGADGGTFFGAVALAPMDVDNVDVVDPSLAGAIFDAPRAAQPVLSAASVATLHVCASAQNVNTRVAALEGRNHPVVMPDGRSERAQICRDIVNGSLLGTGGRNGTVPFDPSRADVTKTVANTARRWTGKPALAGKKEWTTACLMNTPPRKFIGGLNDRLHAGTRLLPSAESTEWMLRVGFSDGLPMHQAFVRGDLPGSVGLGTHEWVKLALGIEQLGERHWDMRHVEVVDAAAIPATNTKAFTALATSLSSMAPHIATQRLRNQLTMQGIPTVPAEATSQKPDAG
ncbi:hypothetical protein AB870_05955 [Pandoraea faecigallinarum]|uniref:Uncharacterized protein n=1 Tax=Pandoraea faecigallinarum TaxID=656179 RepID=A0A0H3WPI7_9BURK|nr:hypothetical protein [Pandoraea faecigallinarum]AKM29757.1 hypothetical protein AB870_05955 [Pandoraea faecigallinarum]